MAKPTEVPDQFKSVTGLGPFKQEYGTGGCGQWVWAGAGLVLVLLGVLSLLGGLGIMLDATRNHTPAFLPSTLMILGMGLLLLVVGGVFIAAIMGAWTTSAAVFENGLALNNRNKLRQVAWADVTAVYARVVKRYRRGLPVGTLHTYTLETAEGEPLEVNEELTNKIAELGQAIQAGVARTQLPRYWKRLKEGETLYFGPLVVDQQKLTVEKQELHWGEIRSFKVEGGKIWVEKDAKGWLNWSTVKVGEIPNFFIFLAIVSQITKVEA